MTMIDKTLAHAPKSDEALEQMAKVLFRPMGADGVYARTALYEEQTWVDEQSTRSV